MRILLINYEFPPLGGGAGNATSHIGRELAAMGDEVFVLTSHFRSLPRREKKDGMNIIRVRASRRYRNKSNPFQMSCFILSASWFLTWNGKKVDPDISLAFLGIPSAPPALFFKWLSGTPYIVSLRGGDVPGAQPEQLATMHKITKPLIKLVWKKAAFVVANSKGLGELAAKTAPQLDIPVIPNGVDLDKFHPAATDTSEQKEMVRILFVGRASREKNIPEALAALSQCTDFKWQFNIVGDGPELNSWKKEARSLGVGENVRFAGWCDKENLPQLYRESDFMIFPSTSEGMPNVVLEAMASGLPLVATSIRGNVDLVKHGENGYLYTPGDLKTLVNHLQSLLGDESKRRKFGIASRERAELFSWAKVAQDYRKLFREVLGHELA